MRTEKNKNWFFKNYRKVLVLWFLHRLIFDYHIILGPLVDMAKSDSEHLVGGSTSSFCVKENEWKTIKIIDKPKCEYEKGKEKNLTLNNNF